jgi:hypothetical protein
MEEGEEKKKKKMKLRGSGEYTAIVMNRKI